MCVYMSVWCKSFLLPLIRLPTECYKKVALLIVNHTNPEECGRPEKAQQVLTNTATSFLNCPLSDHVREVDNYSIQWYKVSPMG